MKSFGSQEEKDVCWLLKMRDLNILCVLEETGLVDL